MSTFILSIHFALHFALISTFLVDTDISQLFPDKIASKIVMRSSCWNRCVGTKRYLFLEHLQEDLGGITSCQRWYCWIGCCHRITSSCRLLSFIMILLKTTQKRREEKRRFKNHKQGRKQWQWQKQGRKSTDNILILLETQHLTQLAQNTNTRTRSIRQKVPFLLVYFLRRVQE